MHSIKHYIEILWELPQFLIGLLIGLFYLDKHYSYKYMKDVLIVRLKNFNKGISLGKIVFIDATASERTVLHELGHSKQSKWLGPLYLIIIGIPSLLHNIIHRLSKRRWNYYSFYTEKWADKIMNIQRN